MLNMICIFSHKKHLSPTAAAETTKKLLPVAFGMIFSFVIQIK
jgi:hypothetical protein